MSMNHLQGNPAEKDTTSVVQVGANDVKVEDPFNYRGVFLAGNPTNYFRMLYRNPLAPSISHLSFTINKDVELRRHHDIMMLPKERLIIHQPLAVVLSLSDDRYTRTFRKHD